MSYCASALVATANPIAIRYRAHAITSRFSSYCAASTCIGGAAGRISWFSKKKTLAACARERNLTRIISIDLKMKQASEKSRKVIFKLNKNTKKEIIILAVIEVWSEACQFSFFFRDDGNELKLSRRVFLMISAMRLSKALNDVWKYLLPKLSFEIHTCLIKNA